MYRHISYSKNIDTTVPTKTIQIISTLKSKEYDREENTPVCGAINLMLDF